MQRRNVKERIYYEKKRLAIISRACRHEGGAERHECQLGEFEALYSERNADDRNAEHHADSGCGERDFDAAEKNPEHVEQQRCRPCAVADFLPEREERQCREFEALHPDGDADDGQAPQYAYDKPCQPEDNPPEKKPK